MSSLQPRKFAPKRQPMISSYFSHSPTRPAKRMGTPIDLTVSDDDGGPPTKKQKTRINEQLFLRGSSSPRSTPAPPVQQPTSSGNASQWRYIPQDNALATQPQRTEAEELSRKRRREYLAKTLITDNSSFHRREHVPADNVPQDDEEIGEDRESEQSGTGSGNESDDKFKQLQDMFSFQGKGKKGKGKKTAQAKQKKAKKVEERGPGGMPFTALEQQIRKLKTKYAEALLMIEVGHKFIFVDGDAQAASRELGIIAYPKRNLITASIPVHRGPIHLKKLLSQGYKVGVVRQTETAALKKVSDNRNDPFDRNLEQMYTAATFVDELDSADDFNEMEAPLLMCLVEVLRGGMGMDEKVAFGMVVICPSTGDVVWDEFEDGHMRTELETRMVHTKPAELLLSKTSHTKPTERLLKHFVRHATGNHTIALERYDDAMSYSEAFECVSDFYTRKTSSPHAFENFTSGKLMAAVTDFPKQVVIAMAQCIKYLANFNLADVLLGTKFFAKFTTQAHMLLNGNTVTNLEIYQNDTDFTRNGSLIWILDKTFTKFGSRLLHSWVGRPLVDIELLRERTDAIEEIISSSSMKLVQLRSVLRGLPDLAKGLCRMQYGKCTPAELAILITAFNKAASAFPGVETPADVGLKSPLLCSIIAVLHQLREPVKFMLDTVSLKKAAQGAKAEMWLDPERYPNISDADMGVQAVDIDLQEELKSIRKILKKPSLQYVTVADMENQIEYPRTDDQTRIPQNWILVTATKKFRRYHTPIVKAKVEERERFREMRTAEADKAFLSFLDEIVRKHYAVLRDAVNKLAVADCLLSLSLVAVSNGYVKPEFTMDEDVLEIVEGRHPMVEALRADPFVPNSVTMGGRRTRSKIITGPNMGGKSSAVRMMALIGIMAQIGSYVPAKAVKMSMLDSVLTRMGASDELARGRSTFMVEMSETSDILHQASERSLVVLDELGRGTSTFDGMAIAQSVLQHLVEVKKCKTLFITHYPLVATELERRFPSKVENVHMGFTEDTRINGVREITFLYRLTTGLATESYGIECARLGGISEDVLEKAADRAVKLRVEVEKRRRRNRAHKALTELTLCLGDTPGRRLSEGVAGLLASFES
ncbi:DNA mismatch repair protein MSH3 [Amylostereum chailletii]|nr:DNA mismatch repair protein MSH3 [Amylostereum chailletii]